MQGAVCHARTCPAPWRRPCFLLSPGPILQPARLAPLPAVADDTRVPTAGRDTLHQPFVVTRLREAPHVGIAAPGDGALCTADRDGIPRMVRAASRAGTVRAAEQRGLVHGVAHLDRRPLDDVVFQRRLAEGPLAPLGLRYGDALARWGLGGAPLQAVCQLPKLGGEVLAVGGPGLAIPPGAASGLRRQEAARSRSMG